MIVGYHVTIGAYGFWLPNDPRGSWSEFVGSIPILKHGQATTVRTRHSVAHQAHDQQQRLRAKSALKYPPVRFTGLQARAIAHGLASCLRTSDVRIWACAIMPDHIHPVLKRTRDRPIEQIVNHLKGAATRQLMSEGIHPYCHLMTGDARPPKCFARGQWTVYLRDDEVQHAVAYVEQNPLKEGLKKQNWRFITPYECPSAM